MISKNKISFIRSLAVKKYRQESGLFVAEGEKLVKELMNSFVVIKEIFATEEWIRENEVLEELHQVNEKELTQISTLSTPNKVCAIAEIPKYEYDLGNLSSILSLALDNIKDPGNLGTIVRLADWFGIENIFCSKECVDAYNSKVVQSSMGSLFRVKVHYVDLYEFLNNLPAAVPVYGTLLKGENIYRKKLSDKGLIVMGNESMGLSNEIIPLLTDKIAIPAYNSQNIRAESLNVAIATAIICAEFRRK